MMEAWGEFESDEDSDERRGPCLVANDKVSSSQSTFRFLAREQNDIINILTE